MSVQPFGAITEEPKRRGARVVDKDGDVWVRGTARWTCQARVDGRRVQRVGRLPWFALVSQYGPLHDTPNGTTLHQTTT